MRGDEAGDRAEDRTEVRPAARNGMGVTDSIRPVAPSAPRGESDPGRKPRVDRGRGHPRVCPDVGPMAARPKRKSSYGLGCHRHGFKEELCEIVDQIERKIDEQPYPWSAMSCPIPATTDLPCDSLTRPLAQNDLRELFD